MRFDNNRQIEYCMPASKSQPLFPGSDLRPIVDLGCGGINYCCARACALHRSITHSSFIAPSHTAALTMSRSSSRPSSRNAARPKTPVVTRSFERPEAKQTISKHLGTVLEDWNCTERVRSISSVLGVYTYK